MNTIKIEVMNTIDEVNDLGSYKLINIKFCDLEIQNALTQIFMTMSRCGLTLNRAMC